MNTPDPFALGGDQRDDAALLTLFREWRGFGNGAPVCGTSRVRGRRKKLKTSTMPQTVRYGISRDRFTTRPQPVRTPPENAASTLKRFH